MPIITKPELTISREINGISTVIQLTPSEVYALSAKLRLTYMYDQTVNYAADCCGLHDIPEDSLWEIAGELVDLSNRDEDEVLQDRIYNALEHHGLFEKD